MELLLPTLYSLLVTSSILIIIACLYAFIIWTEHRKYAHLPGPPLDSFFLGHLPSITNSQKRGRYYHYLFLEWAEKYKPMFKLFVFHKVLIIPTEPLLFKELLTRSKYPKSRMSYQVVINVFGSRFLGNGLVTNFDHSSWFARRMAINPAFHKRNLSGFINDINAVANCWMNKLSSYADESTSITMADYLGRFTLDLVTKLVFKMELCSVDDECCPLYAALNKVLEGVSMQNKDPLIKFKPHKRAYVKGVREAVMYIRDVGRQVITERLEAMARGESFGDDILSYLVHVPANSAWKPTFEDIIDDFVTILVAGQETSSNTLTFALSELGKHPEKLAKVESELDEVLGDRDEITVEDVGRLKYMEMVLKETLRLYPTAVGTGRENMEDIQFEGYRIPAHSFLVCSFFISHRLSSNFENPHDFIPERFENSRLRAPYTFMPFSLGLKSCIGKDLAMIQMKIWLSKFIRRFHFTVDNSQSFDINEIMTLRLKDGCRVTMSLKRPIDVRKYVSRVGD